MSKKKLFILCSKLLYKIGQDFLYIHTVRHLRIWFELSGVSEIFLPDSPHLITGSSPHHWGYQEGKVQAGTEGELLRHGHQETQHPLPGPIMLNFHVFSKNWLFDYMVYRGTRGGGEGRPRSPTFFSWVLYLFSWVVFLFSSVLLCSRPLWLKSYGRPWWYMVTF